MKKLKSLASEPMECPGAQPPPAQLSGAVGIPESTPEVKTEQASQVQPENPKSPGQTPEPRQATPEAAAPELSLKPPVDPQKGLLEEVPGGLPIGLVAEEIEFSDGMPFTKVAAGVACEPDTPWNGYKQVAQECADACARAHELMFVWLESSDKNCKCVSQTCRHEEMEGASLYKIVPSGVLPMPASGMPPPGGQAEQEDDGEKPPELFTGAEFSLIGDKVSCDAPGKEWLGVKKTAQECADACFNKQEKQFVWVKNGDKNCKCVPYGCEELPWLDGAMYSIDQTTTLTTTTRTEKAP